MSSKSPAEVAILLPQNDQFNFAQTLARKIHSVEITKLSSDTGSLVRKLFSAQFVGENLILLWRALLLYWPNLLSIQDVQNLRKEDLSEGPLPSSADASSSRLPRVSAKDTTKLQLSEGPLSSSTDSEAGNAENKKPMSGAGQNDKRGMLTFIKHEMKYVWEKRARSSPSRRHDLINRVTFAVLGFNVAWWE